LAREEQDREDLLAEAVALVERVEIELPDSGGRVIAGFRRDGCGSVYFDADPAYHFNSRHELRRAFAGGRLFKAQRGCLVALQRVRTASEVQLVRHELSDAETTEFLRELAWRLQSLEASLRAGAFRLLGQVPESANVIGRCLAWLPQVGRRAPIAASARVL
jgi:hypothetical protein